MIQTWRKTIGAIFEAELANGRIINIRTRGDDQNEG